MRNTYVIMASLVLVLTFALFTPFGFNSEPSCHIDELGLLECPMELDNDFDITHEEAEELCSDLGLIYDYEAVGFTTAEFCYDIRDQDEHYES